MAAHNAQPHHGVTDEEFFNALSPNGLDLAEQQLAENLERALEDEAFPAKDAIVGLSIIRGIRQSQDDEDDEASA